MLAVLERFRPLCLSYLTTSSPCLEFVMEAGACCNTVLLATFRFAPLGNPDSGNSIQDTEPVRLLLLSYVNLEHEPFRELPLGNSGTKRADTERGGRRKDKDKGGITIPHGVGIQPFSGRNEAHLFGQQKMSPRTSEINIGVLLGHGQGRFLWS